MILIIVVAVITIILCKVIYWAENNLYDIFNPVKYVVNDFTNIKCTTQDDLVTCDIIVNKDKKDYIIAFNFLKKDITFDFEIELYNLRLKTI